MSDKVIVTGETISRVADMISERNAKVAALEAELELTRKAMAIALRDCVAVYNCLICKDLICKNKRSTCAKTRCIRNMHEWAMEKAKEEQR
jgi:hypothetical protein